MKFVAITGKEASAPLFDIWDDTLCDIPPEQLEAACDRLLKTWRLPNLPTPGDVRAQLDQANDKAFELEAESKWQRLLIWIRENYFPDVGIRRGAPHLEAEVEHAARAAGGYHFIERGFDRPQIKKLPLSR